MTADRECVRFLQWALPRLGYRWPGFRKVRRQVCRRVRRRVRELELPGLDAYRHQLERNPAEWARLDGCCRITISRFYRDRRLWDVLGREVLPDLYRRAAERDPPALRVWSAGCGAGEEPFTVVMLLRLGPQPLPGDLAAEILGTDLDPHQLERARRAVYPASSLRDLPAEWREEAFAREAGGDYRLRRPYAGAVGFARQDLRREGPPGPFDLILCRNLAFTYFDATGQARSLENCLGRMASPGYLAVGSHESVPGDGSRVVRLGGGLPLYKCAPRSADS